MNIIEHSGLDPKTSILVKVCKDLCQLSKGLADAAKTPLKSILRDLENEAFYDGLEVWSLSDVVFLDDSPSVLGRVVTVDQQQAIVDIAYASSESGTMSSTSAALSTLKVFKINEIESCMEKSLSVNLRHATPIKGMEEGEESSRSPDSPRDTPGSASTKDTGSGTVTLSQHIAGVVQHRPACLLTPSILSATTLPHSTQDSERETSTFHASPCTCIHGYRPLAVQITDRGPIMLVKRISDGTAFLVCSGHPGFPSFSSTSFVSLNSRDSKPRKCTISEESVSARDGGLDRASWTTKNTDVDRVTKTEDGMELSSALDLMSNAHPSFLRFQKSDAVILQDSNGIICPLAEGLRLKPSSVPSKRGKSPQPMQPYKCIASRFHWVKKDCGTMIVVLGKHGNLCTTVWNGGGGGGVYGKESLSMLI